MTEKKVEAQTLFEDGFKIRPSELGFADSNVRVFAVEHSDGQVWVAPGATIMVGKKLVFTYWDGVFFVPQKKGSIKRL